MHQNSPPKIANPFMDPSQPTMADLIAIVSKDETLSPVRRANLASSIRRFCAALGCDPTQVPANHWYFKQRLKRFHPLEKGIKKKRWQTIKADVAFALRNAGFTKGKPRSLAPLSAEWLAFKAIDQSPRFFWGFSRLAHYCSAAGVAPTAVNDRVIAAFTTSMEQETFKTNTDRVLRELCVRWNKMVATFPDLGLQHVSEPSFIKNLTCAWEELPETFRAQADAWLTNMSQDAPLLSEEGPIRALRPASITSYRYSLRQAVAALVAHGRDLKAVDQLSVLIEGDNPKLILGHFLARNGGKTSSMVHGIAHVLLRVAEYGCDAEAGAIAKIKRFRAQLALKRDGLRPRPKEALRAFADVANIEKILSLPVLIHQRLRRQTNFSRKDILLMQAAVSLELLLMRPVRRKNIVELRIDQTIVRVGRGMLISIPADDVKNGVELTHKLPPESVEILDFYIKRILPLIGANPNGWLFPGEDGVRHKTGEQFSRNFSKMIREMTGLRFYPHLTRHFGAFLYLNENPGGFEVVRRVLAHKSLETTTRSYVGFENESAVRTYDELVLRIRDTMKREADDAAA